jgi:hypothetical protein
MKNITVEIPKDLYNQMKLFPGMNWSKVVRKALEEKLEIFKLGEKLAKKRKLTKKDIDNFNKRLSAMLSEKTLAKDWLSKEEDEAWKDL